MYRAQVKEENVMRQKTRDMTSGKPAGIIVSFALPLMLGNVFQQLYTVMDSVIVGRGVGVEALAALGTSDWLSFTAMGGITGVAQGFSVLIAQCFGAKDEKRLKKAVAMSVWTGSLITLLIMALFIGNLSRLLGLLRVPDNIRQPAHNYLLILMFGLVATALYNICSGILRAMGDSQAPLRAMIGASAVNIILDLIFVLVFHWGVEGAALGTVLAQVCSGAICFWQLKKYGIWNIEKADWKWDWEMAGHLLGLGIPVAFQNVIIGFGGIVIQYVINGFGLLYVAGFTATNKLYGLLELAAVSFGYATSSFVGQNLGAGEYGRIKEGVRASAKISIGIAVAIGAVLLLFGRSILKIFISPEASNASEVLTIAYNYLAVMGATLIILYLLHIYRSALQGMGDTLIPMCSGIAELVMRILIALLLPLIIGKEGIYFAETGAWLGAMVILIGAYRKRIRRFD